jgi:hypothetical protein
VAQGLEQPVEEDLRVAFSSPRMWRADQATKSLSRSRNRSVIERLAQWLWAWVRIAAPRSAHFR